MIKLNELLEVVVAKELRVAVPLTREGDERDV